MVTTVFEGNGAFSLPFELYQHRVPPVCFLRGAGVSSPIGGSSRRPEIRTNTGEQVVLAEWFGEIANHAGLQSALPRPFVGKGSNEDGGNGLTGRDQSIMKLNSGHPRHLHVCNHAGHFASPSGFQKILGAVKRHCNIAQRPDEARQSLSHRLIVVDDRYDGFPWQFRSLPRTTTNVPHGRPPLY